MSCLFSLLFSETHFWIPSFLDIPDRVVTFTFVLTPPSSPSFVQLPPSAHHRYPLRRDNRFLGERPRYEIIVSLAAYCVVVAGTFPTSDLFRESWGANEVRI